MKWDQSNRPSLGDTKRANGVEYRVLTVYPSGVVCNGEKVFTAAEWVALPGVE